jgi:hypothetical protein
LNIRGIKSKVNKHISDNSVDIFCLAETFLRGNDKPRDLHSDFNWIGKCRTQSKGKGGICVNSDITILDDNLINSQRSSVCGFYVV